MPQISEYDHSFGLSPDELRRRERAFDRLCLSAIVTFCIGLADLFDAYLPELVGGIACLTILFLASRVWLRIGNRRFAQTTWSIGQGTLTRADSRSRHEHPLDAVRRIQVKRTTSGAVREIKLSFDDGSAVYVNGLDDPEAFRECLVSSVDVPQDSLREPIDYDHPSFYMALGFALGASVSLMTRVAISAAQFDGHWVYVALAAYSLAVGVFWLRAKPISGRYGIRAVSWDYTFSAAAFVCFIGSTIAATAF